MRYLVLLTAALALAACERADDLDVAVAPVVQGAPIDTSLTTPAVEQVAPAPEAATPEIAESEATEPETTEPETTEPETTEPETTEPESAEPETAEPEATQPDTAGEVVSDSATATVTLGDTDPGGDPPLVDPKLVEPVLKDGVWYTSFDYLGAFDSGIMALGEGSVWAQHATEAEKAEAGQKGIPKAVQKLDQQVVELEGYMIPLKFEKGNVRTFYLSRYMMSCCFGVLPKANEVVEVEMVNEDGALYDAYMPIVVTGVLSIHAEGSESEYLKTVFTMKGKTYRFSDEW